MYTVTLTKGRKKTIHSSILCYFYQGGKLEKYSSLGTVSQENGYLMRECYEITTGCYCC